MAKRSSVCKVVLEALDPEISETDDQGGLLMFGKVAMLGVVGNEHGAHHTVAECRQALNDTGFSVPANAATSWVGEAMQTVGLRDAEGGVSQGEHWFLDARRSLRVRTAVR